MFSTTWKHIRRSPYQAFAAVFIMTQTFFVVSLFAFLIVGSARIISFFESQPQMNVFFKDEAKQEDIDALIKQFNDTGKVSSVTFVSKEEAFKRYTSQFKEDPLLLEFVTPDTLPASLDISTKKLDDLLGFSDLLHAPIIDKVVVPKDIISKLTSWTDALRKIGLGLSVILLLDSIFLMVIIIGIRISQKRDEIEIMRLLSASNSYIRFPFVLEGMFYGCIGALFGWLLASGALLYATPFLASFLRGIPLFPVPPVFFVFVLGVEVCVAIILGWFSSFLAVYRYLKQK